MPIHQHLMAATEHEACACPRGVVALTFCHGCGLVFNAAFDPGQLCYGAGYENAQEYSDVFSNYLDDLTEDLGRRYDLVGRTVRFARALREFADSCARWRSSWRAKLEELAARGACVLWGAGAKSVAFLNQIDETARTVRAVADINPYKQGRYLAGTGHEVVTPRALEALRPATVLVANSNYLDEIRAMLRELGCSPDVILLEQQAALR
jgi:hypothetical protein